VLIDLVGHDEERDGDQEHDQRDNPQGGAQRFSPPRRETEGHVTVAGRGSAGQRRAEPPASGAGVAPEVLVLHLLGHRLIRRGALLRLIGRN
jgi:hypothetical protein